METQFKILKILNNNAVLGRSHTNEVIVSKKGIGFAYHAGDWINNDQTFKIYYLDTPQIKNRFELLFSEIPYEYIRLTEQIIEQAQTELEQPLNQLLLITLADHIHFAIERHREGISQYGMQNEEIRRFFPKEYKIAEAAVALINKTYQITLEKSEPSMIAFHIINAEYQSTNKDATAILTAINDILEIIEQSLSIKLSEDSPDYSRLVIHLKFFLKNVFAATPHTEDKFENLNLNLNNQSSVKAKTCVENIAQYLQEKYDYTASSDEKFYLIIHMIRIMG